MELETLHAMVEKASRLYPSRVAVIEDTGSSRRDIVYKELWHFSSMIADTICSIGSPSHPRTSELIAVCVDQCLLYPAVILGILRRSCGFACIDPTWTLDKQMDLMETLGISMLVHNDEALRKSICSEKQCCVEMRGMFLYFETFNHHRISRKCPHSLAYAVLTSGSTGDAKIVRVPHSSLIPNVVSLRQILDISVNDVIFLSSPSTFDPSIVDLFLALSSGASLLVTSSSMKGSAKSLLNILFPIECTTGVSVLQMTPSLFNRWSDQELKDIVFGPKTSLRALILGGEPFPPVSKFKFCEELANAPTIYNIYGVTEVSAWASIFQVRPSAHDFPNSLGSDERNPVLLGQPLSDTFFEVRDCTTGSVIHTGCGELFVGSSRRICEIGNENCLDFCLPVYRATGDIVQVYPNGNTFYMGRKDRSIKRWGHRVNLEKIECIALSCPAVQSACCVWCELENKLYLVVSSNEETFSKLALQHYLLQFVGSEKVLVPDEIIQVQDASLTNHGKLNYQRVLEFVQTRISSSIKNSDKSFLELCADVLGLLSVNKGSFLHLGGNSLLAITLITQLENAFGDVPAELPSMLLSGDSLLDIDKKLSHYYNERTNNAKSSEPLIVDKESTRSKSPGGEKFLPIIPVSNAKNPPKQNSDKLISFSLRGRTSGEDTCFRINQMSLCSTTMILSWKQDLGKCIDASPLCMIYESGVTGIIIGSHSGAFTFFEGSTGEPQWSIRLPHRIESSACPSKCGSYLYVGCYDGALYCVCTRSGKLVWSFFTGGMVKCTPALCNEGKSVIFGSYDYQVYCVNSESGELQWSSSFGEKGSWIASPLIINNLAILCSLASKAYAVQTSDGQVLWRVSFLQPLFSTPSSFICTGDTKVVIADVKGTILCLRLSSGKEVARWQAPGHVFAPMTILQNTALRCAAKHLILVACYDQHIYALSVNGSTEMSVEWKINLGASIGSAPFPFVIRTHDDVKNVCAAVVNSAGRVFLLCLDNGKIISEYDVNSEVFSSPVVIGGRIYFGCRDNNVYSLEIK